MLLNASKLGAQSLAERFAARARSAGCSVAMHADFPLSAEALQGFDLCVVIGGDGTLLGAVTAAANANVPTLGINLGRLGFMTHISPEAVDCAVSDLLSGHFVIQRRALLQAHTADGSSFCALNDVVIKAAASRLIRLRVCCDGELMNTFHADGLIFATPTGSTAYNLSAGGPIVHPAARVLLVTPINPHTLSNRSIVLDATQALEVEALTTDIDTRIAADGVERPTDSTHFPIRIAIDTQRSLPLIEPKGLSHFSVLRSKLHWSVDPAHAQSDVAPSPK